MAIKADLNKQMLKFLLSQGAILAGVVAVFLVLSGVFFVQKETSFQRQKIEDGLLAFAKQATQSSEIPKRGDLGELTFFILTDEGKYVLPRLSRSDEDEKLWQEYELKLIYEMQKRHDGWVYYPDRTDRRWNDGQCAVRYIFQANQGWIIAAQGYIPAAASLLQGFFTPQLWGWIFVILCLALGAVLWNAFWHLKRVMKMVIHSQQEDFIVTQGTKTPIDERIFVRQPEGLKEDVIDGKVRPAVLPTLPKEKSEHVLTRSTPAEDEAVDGGSAPGPRPLKLKPYSREEGAEDLDTPKRATLGQVTIDTAEIKSSLLRRVIEEMRQVKK